MTIEARLPGVRRIGGKWRISVALAASLVAVACGGTRYLDAAAPVEQRIDDLLARMTLDEKLGQMALVRQDAISPAQVTEYAIGGVLSGGGGAPQPNTIEAWLEMTGGFQEAALATRLRIPILYGSDAVHGHSNLYGAVIFPHNIGLGATRSADLVERIGRATAIEAAATGVNWNYAPVLAVPQDLRWGRTYEAYGADTALVAELGTAYLRGLQGDDLTMPDTVLATPKHYVGDGATEWGTSRTGRFSIDQGDARIDEDELRRIHLAPYRAAIDAGALSVMASYSSWNGTKVHAHRYLLTDVLKGELGFEGFVVSDWAAIDQIDPDDYDASVIAAVNAGVDMNMVPTDYVRFIASLRQAVRRGDISEERIDDAVRRILRAKFALGLFEAPHPDPALVAAVGSGEHRALAAEAVERSLVLLVNDGTTLPIEAETIFVAGVAADDIGRQSGGWTISWQGGVGATTEGSTILDGVRRLAGPAATVVYDPSGRFGGEGVPERADVGIVVVGEFPYAEGEGDTTRLSLDLREQERMLGLSDRVDSLVVILLSGRPLVVGDLMLSADVLVAAWLPGSEGAAVAGPLFGTAPFSGRLPMDWPQAGRYATSAEDGAVGCDVPVFPFGHGLKANEAFRLETFGCDGGSKEADG